MDTDLWWLWFLIALVLLLLLAWWLSWQAGRSAQPKTQEHPDKASTIQPDLAAADDLTILEGIGPKIAQVLKDAGIHTFSQLAGTPVVRLEEILRAANLRLGDPTTWPEQAALAAKGDWTALQAFTDQLKGGRKV